MAVFPIFKVRTADLFRSAFPDFVISKNSRFLNDGAFVFRQAE
jgi:hypothetical protein